MYGIDTWILSGDPIFSTHSSTDGGLYRDYTAFKQQCRNFAPETCNKEGLEQKKWEDWEGRRGEQMAQRAAVIHGIQGGGAHRKMQWAKLVLQTRGGLK